MLTCVYSTMPYTDRHPTRGGSDHRRVCGVVLHCEPHLPSVSGI